MGKNYQADINILLVRKHEPARIGLQLMLERIPFVGTIDVTDSLEVVIEIAKRGHPNIIIASTDMSARELEILTASAPKESRVLVLVPSFDQEHLIETMQVPVEGFLLEPDLTVGILADCLHSLKSGTMPFPVVLRRQLLTLADVQAARKNARSSLTIREREVLRLLAKGLTNKEIAAELAVSYHTARRYVANILQKMGCPNRAAAVALAIQKKLLV